MLDVVNPSVSGSILNLLIFMMIVTVYVLPSLFAVGTKAPRAGTVVVINLLLGWTVIGWVVALVMAMRDPHR